MKSIGDIVSSGLCIGCGACFGACPQKPLESIMGDRGFPQPVIPANCKACRNCLASCPQAEDADQET